MTDFTKFYINGEWVAPVEPRSLAVINPATEEPVAQISLGGARDVDKAVAAAKAAFPGYSRSSKEERLALLQKVVEAYKARYDELAQTITKEMGAPAWLANRAQAAVGMAHLNQMLAILKGFAFEEQRGSTRIVKEPVGVCGFITPWNCR